MRIPKRIQKMQEKELVIESSTRLIFFFIIEGKPYVYDNEKDFTKNLDKANAHSCRAYLTTLEAKKNRHRSITSARNFLRAENRLPLIGNFNTSDIERAISDRMKDVDISKLSPVDMLILTKG